MKQHRSIKELPIAERDKGEFSSKALRPKNVIGVLSLIIKLFFELNFKKIIK